MKKYTQKKSRLSKPCPKEFLKIRAKKRAQRNYAGIYSRLFFSSLKTNLTNFLAVNAIVAATHINANEKFIYIITYLSILDF